MRSDATTGWEHPHSPSAWSLPDYFEDLRECEELIQELEELRWSCVIVWERKKRRCTFVRFEEEHTAFADTAEEAICEAYLRVRGLWQSEDDEPF